MKKTYVFLFLAALLTGLLSGYRVTYAFKDETPQDVAKRISDFNLGLARFELSSEMGQASPGCSRPKNGYDQFRPYKTPALFLFESCTITSQKFSYKEPVTLLQIQSLGDLQDSKFLGLAALYNATYHFDDGAHIVIDDQKPIMSLQLQCKAQIDRAKILGFIPSRRYSVNCRVLDVLGFQKGTVLLTEK
jgi:hypothetical protein